MKFIKIFVCLYLCINQNNKIFLTGCKSKNKLKNANFQPAEIQPHRADKVEPEPGPVSPVLYSPSLTPIARKSCWAWSSSGRPDPNADPWFKPPWKPFGHSLEPFFVNLKIFWEKILKYQISHLTDSKITF